MLWQNKKQTGHSPIWRMTGLSLKTMHQRCSLVMRLDQKKNSTRPKSFEASLSFVRSLPVKYLACATTFGKIV